MTRPGFGVPHPALRTLLEHERPAATHEIRWADGTMPLRVSAYTEPAQVPAELVTSVRCVVRVGDRIVFCENSDGSHPWPGGRRQPGESYDDTAAREVHEETGWLIRRESLVPIGWLRLTHLSPPPPGTPTPHPDFLQVVFTATAVERDGDSEVPWTDTDGYELRSRLVTLDEALKATTDDLLASVFLESLRDRGFPHS